MLSTKRSPEQMDRARVSEEGYISQAFGLRWHSDWPNPWFAAAPADGVAADVELTRCDSLKPRHGGRRINSGEVFTDGTRFSLNGAVIDMFDGRRVEWYAPHATEVPLALSSTVAACVLAWRGCVPLHGSAVAFDGSAILIAGRSGAGKSTLAHALVERGGKLVSDDLSMLMPLANGDVPKLLPGRPAIRLCDTEDDGANLPKQLSLPPRVDPDQQVPLALMVVLRRQAVEPGIAAKTVDLMEQLFRPSWMRALPNANARLENLLRAAAHVRVAALPPASDIAAVTPDERAAMVLAMLQDRQTG